MTEHEFPHLETVAARLGARTDLTLPELRELLCRDCDFFHEDHEDDLECSSFRMLRMLIARGVSTPAELSLVLGPRPAAE